MIGSRDRWPTPPHRLGGTLDEIGGIDGGREIL